MPRRSKRGLHLPIISLGPFEAMAGDYEALENGSDEDYVTVMAFVLPLEEEEFAEGTYSLTHVDFDSPLTIKLYQINDVFKDTVFQNGKNFYFGANVQLQDLPFSIFTDNRAKYPCFYAEIVFPFRLKDWRRPPSEEKTKQFKLTGIYSTDKILALKVLNNLFASNSYPANVRPLEYEDVTNFVEQYFRKDHSHAWLYQHLILLDSRNAFEEGIVEYLGKDLWDHVSGFVTKKEGTDINTEADLHEVVMEVIIDIIKHHVENRNWIQPFWNDSHKINVKGAKRTIPKQPKREPSIQPTLSLLLQITLTRFGIHVERETDEGVGLLDFKCLYTTKEGKLLRVLIEFKLAHHKDIGHGLKAQLPAYLTANNSNHGIYLVMWFKDAEGKVFNKPFKRTKIEMITELKQMAAAIRQEKGFIIAIEIIDASVRPSASKL